MEIKIEIKTDERKKCCRVANVSIDNTTYSFYSNDRTLYMFLRNLMRDIDLKVKEG